MLSNAEHLKMVIEQMNLIADKLNTLGYEETADDISYIKYRLEVEQDALAKTEASARNHRNRSEGL